jgi:cyclic pyranopterin phosphate synthase
MVVVSLWRRRLIISFTMLRGLVRATQLGTDVPLAGNRTARMVVNRRLSCSSAASVSHPVNSQLKSTVTATNDHSSSPLTDTFGRFHSYLRISLTEKCNLRCVYCMPAEGVALTCREDLLNFEERKRTIEIFARLGINKVRFTGGEPTLSKDLIPLISACRSFEGIKSIGMTTNAILLSNRMLDDLKTAGLSSINISLDSLNADRFAMMSRRDKKGLMKVLSAIFSSVAKGLHVKVNCVLMRGVNDDEMTQFIEMTKDMNLDVRFIELMPFDGNEWSRTKVRVIASLLVLYVNSQRFCSSWDIWKLWTGVRHRATCCNANPKLP